MLNKSSNTETEDTGDASLGDRRLKSIGNGDLDWMGKGFLAVIKKDCEKPKNAEKQTNGSKN